MIFEIYELVMRWRGYRKTGSRQRTEIYELTTDNVMLAGTPRKITTKSIKNTPAVYNGDFNLSGNTETNQGPTSACGCATLCSYLEDWIIRTEKDKTVGINWKDMWEDMKYRGLASEEEGSYLQDNIWYLQNIGVKDNYGRTWIIDGFEKISKLNIEDRLRQGHEIYTGSLVAIPMTDSKYVYKNNRGQYGHAYRLIGIENGMILAETTWKNYGLRRESQFYIQKQGISDLFSCYIFTFKISK